MTKKLLPAGTMLGPLPPAMVSCGTLEKPNVLTIAWTGIINSEPPMTYVSVRPGRYSHDIIKDSGEFVINLPSHDMVKVCDHVGTISGKTINKFEQYDLTPAACDGVMAPQILEAPISLACKVVSTSSFKTHDMFLAEIVGVYVDEGYLNDEGKWDPETADMLVYLNGHYYKLGKLIGQLGFSLHKDESKKKLSLKASEKSSETQEEPPKDKFMINRFKRKETKAEKFERIKAEKGATFDARKKRSREDGFSDRPPRKDFGDRPARRDFGDRPARRDFGDRPPRKDFGDRPSRKDFGDRPPRRDFGDRPARRDFGDRPARRDFGDRPARRDFGDRPPRKDFGDRPPRRDFGDRPPRKSFGDKPARKAFDKKPGTTFRGSRSFKK